MRKYKEVITMSVTKQVLDWTEEKFEEALEEDSKHSYLKAFGLGAIEGFIDGAVLMYPILVAGLFIAGKELKKLKGE